MTHNETDAGAGAHTAAVFCDAGFAAKAKARAPERMLISRMGCMETSSTRFGVKIA